MAKPDATSETAVAEILLQGNDLPPEDKNYLTLMSPDEYVERYGDTPEVVDNGRRWLIVLPLHVDVHGIDGVIPIPFIVDTGAPEVIYLGSGARNIFKEMQVLNNAMALDRLEKIYRLRGIVRYRGKSLKNPVAEEVPARFEKILKDDVRINLLGIKGINALEVLKLNN